MSNGIEGRYLMRELGMNCSGEYLDKTRIGLVTKVNFMVYFLKKIQVEFAYKWLNYFTFTDEQIEMCKEITDFLTKGCTSPGVILYEDELEKSSSTEKVLYEMKMKKFDKFKLDFIYFFFSEYGRIHRCLFRSFCGCYNLCCLCYC